MLARIQIEHVSLALPARLVSLSLGGLAPGWCAPPLGVLHGIHLSLDDGDRLAVVGPPGAGKTMLLRLLAGRTAATSGWHEVRGQVVDLVDPEERLDPKASGQQHLDRLLGPLRALLAQTAATSTGLGDLLDVPVGHYSPGMRWRLAFALATVQAGEVVLADEVLQRCDLAFRPLAESRLVRLIERARVAVLVERDLAFLERRCNKALWLERGIIRQLGPTPVVLAAYRARLGRTAEPASLADAS